MTFHDQNKFPVIAHDFHNFFDPVDSLFMNYEAIIKVNKYKSWTEKRQIICNFVGLLSRIFDS